MGIQMQMLVGERKRVHAALLDPTDRRSSVRSGSSGLSSGLDAKYRLCGPQN
jgi:hypothetical protein